MKKLLNLVVLAALTISANAQSKPYNQKLDGPFTSIKTIKVNGICDISKRTIEAKLKNTPGIYIADWDASSKLLLVKYNRLKITTNKIEELVASTGHDTPNVKANNDAYNALPEGCKYDRKQG
jgi:hypothetical protein